MSGSGEARILVVEDNDVLRRGVALALREAWGRVDEAGAGDEAIARIERSTESPYDVVVTDLRLPGADGVAVLRAAREADPRTRVVLMTAYGTIETAVEAMRCGAFDFVQKPLDLEQVELRVARAVDHGRRIQTSPAPRSGRSRTDRSSPIVGGSPALREAVELGKRVAPTRSTVLVTGETGTGKELIARLVHGASRRSGGPLVQVNCAALPEPLLESELFGHERGAFTGAERRRVGRFEEASGGTLFLDEVGELSPSTQAKLLRVLQEQEFHRLGGSSVLRTDARIVAATNGDLEALTRSGRFREDLFFRLNVIRIHLPPLRERKQDLVALAQHFLGELCDGSDASLRGFTPAALSRLRVHDWPGNARELRNVLERAVLVARGPRLDASDLSLGVRGADRGSGWRPELPPSGWTLDDVERALVIEALQRTGWVQKEASKLLGVSPRKLNYMIRRMGITHAAWRRNAGPGGDAPAGAGGANAAGDPP